VVPASAPGHVCAPLRAHPGAERIAPSMTELRDTTDLGFWPTAQRRSGLNSGARIPLVLAAFGIPTGPLTGCGSATTSDAASSVATRRPTWLQAQRPQVRSAATGAKSDPVTKTTTTTTKTESGSAARTIPTKTKFTPRRPRPRRRAPGTVVGARALAVMTDNAHRRTPTPTRARVLIVASGCWTAERLDITRFGGCVPAGVGLGCWLLRAVFEQGIGVG
jgi:hypothetical protein